ncbi:MAG: 3-deoxy-8-phosphooctulonate synthase [Gemmatimonadetes bacterium RIFCSPLOWO2_12_FULL_68_9]|nr:MAG: 3-deoxy-8-phosphooctulonate synthase [Gemmatimonadetes bacterium RIFCSPLOWO2_12_FULL_68_9]
MTALWAPGPVLIAGPCVVESDDVNLRVANVLAELARTLGLRVVYKASFDKANRTNPDAPRGPGLDAGLAALARVREASGLPVLTDVHQPAQVDPVATVVDAVQVPAFLCRQTDLLEAVGRAGKPVNLKKGQWASPQVMAAAVEKVRRAHSSAASAAPAASGGPEIAVTERGTFFGYEDLVVDMRSFARIRAAADVPVLFDATHSVQRPGRGRQGATGGCREDVPALLLAAAAAGADGFFLETHPDPARALSDSATMWPLAELPVLVARAIDVWRTAREVA